MNVLKGMGLGLLLTSTIVGLWYLNPYVMNRFHISVWALSFLVFAAASALLALGCMIELVRMWRQK